MYYFLYIHVVIILFLEPCNFHYLQYTGHRIIGKLIWMDLELVKDIDMKVQAVQHVRIVHYKNSIYQIGEQVYDVKFKYRRMMVLYERAEIETDITRVNRTSYLVEVQSLAMDIDKMIKIVEEIEKPKVPRSERKDFLKDFLRTKKGAVKNPNNLQNAKYSDNNATKSRANKIALRAMMKKITNHEQAPAKRRHRDQKYREDGFESDYVPMRQFKMQ